MNEAQAPKNPQHSRQLSDASGPLTEPSLAFRASLEQRVHGGADGEHRAGAGEALPDHAGRVGAIERLQRRRRVAACR